MKKLLFTIVLIVILSGCAPRGPITGITFDDIGYPVPVVTDAYPAPVTPTLAPYTPRQTPTPPPLTPRWRLW